MAHNLNFRNGKASFAATGELAWHGLGQYVQEAMTAAQAMELAQLDYEVKKIPLIAKLGGDDAFETDVEHRVATVRMDTKDVLGIVSPSYEIVQNSDCFNFFDALIDEGEAIYQTAGALGKGERVFLTAKLPNDILVRGEEIDQYVMLTNGHDGNNALIAALTPIRVVCNNTLTAALGSCTNKVTIYHQKNAQAKLKEAHKVMGMASKYVMEVQPIYEKMALTPISEKELLNLIAKAVAPNVEQVTNKEELKELSKRSQNTVERIFDFARFHDTQRTDAAKGTVWGAFNSISGFLGWEKTYPSREQRMKDITFGTGAKQIQKAFDLAAELVD